MTDESLFWHFSAASNKSHQQERKKKEKKMSEQDGARFDRTLSRISARVIHFFRYNISFLFVVTPFRKKR